MAKFTTRPVIMGRKGVVTAGHYLAATAGHRIMEKGGNAIDAAAAMSICVNLLEPQSCGIAGEVPTLIYSAKDRKSYAISGVGWSPESFSIEWCRNNGIDLIPGDGYLPITVPAPIRTWGLALAKFGTLSFADILAPAIELAEYGYPMYPSLRDTLINGKEKYLNLYPTTGEIYLPKGKAPDIGDLLINTDFANMLKLIVSEEKNNINKGRIAGIEAGCNAFYKGPIAETILDFISNNPVEDASGSSHTGLLSDKDLSEWNAEIDEPLKYNYKGLDVLKCSSWTQGPVFLQQLAILQNYDLKSMGHNSTEYLHTLIESAKLAFADREAYYGDPKFDDVPFDHLLSDSYNKNRSSLIDQKASMDLIAGNLADGKVPEYISDTVQDNNRYALGIEKRPTKDLGLGHSHTGDTTHLDAIDQHGNMVAATPSGGWLGTSPIVKGLGFPMGTRGQMFYLNPVRPNALEPRKRPRATLTPTMVTRNGNPEMVFGTPGGDSQDQWTLQFFLNYYEFGMNLQEALDAASIHSIHFPSSFYPREAFPGEISAEDNIPSITLKELEQKGHIVNKTAAWAHGKVMGITIDTKRNLISGASAAKGIIGYCIGW